MSDLEKVAKAIITARAGEAAADYARQWDNANWLDALRQARAAVEALREPSEGMVEAGDQAMRESPVSELFREVVIYRAMIDHVLKEG